MSSKDKEIRKAEDALERADSFLSKMRNVFENLREPFRDHINYWNRFCHYEDNLEHKEWNTYRSLVHRINRLRWLDDSDKSKLEDLDSELKRFENQLKHKLPQRVKSIAAAMAHAKGRDKWYTVTKSIDEIETMIDKAHMAFARMHTELDKIEMKLNKNPAFGVDKEFVHAFKHSGSHDYIHHNLSTQLLYHQCFTIFHAIDTNLNAILKTEYYPEIENMKKDIQHMRATLHNSGYINPIFLKTLYNSLTKVCGINPRTGHTVGGDPRIENNLKQIYDFWIELEALSEQLKQKRHHGF